MAVSIPRSRSEDVLKVKAVLTQGGFRDGNTLSASSPELRSMLISLNTTVPQNLRPESLSSTHRPRRRQHRLHHHSAAKLSSFCAMPARCSLRLVLVVFQITIGCTLTAVSTYVFLFIPAMRIREKPIWAGVPLLLAGLSGIFFLERDNKKQEGSTVLFILKTACTSLAAISVFVCVTAAVFCGIHVGQLFTYAYCKHLTNGCVCYQTLAANSKSHLYSPVEDCFLVYCHIKIFLITLGSLSVLGGFSALFFVISIWKSRYGEINTAAQLEE
ncbi:hypothetical protein BsWGS_16838 [Bradybaena similaris]